MKFIQLVITIIIMLLLVGFFTDCNGSTNNPFSKIVSRLGFQNKYNND
jgi:hypothetical protein